MSIRLRLAVVFAVASALVFTVGSWLFAAALSSSLLGTIDAQLSSQLSGASRYFPAQGSSGGSSSVQGSPASGEFVVQVIDQAGHVRGASADAGSTPMLSPAQLSQARQHQITATNSDEGEQERLMAAPLPQHPGWVAAASVSLDAFNTTRSDVTRELLIAGAVFVAAAGLGGYGLARAALSPVERLRREVAAVSARDPAPTIQVPRTRDEIAALARTMNQLLGRLQGALARQRALVADASHELRTPFAVLRGELELAGRPGRSQPELAAAVQRASEEAARLARITDQLLFLARSDEDRIPPRLARTNIAVLLNRSAEHAAGRASAAGVSCRVEAPANLVADVDPDRIREAIDNLVDNALRFAPRGTPIVLAAGATGRDLVLQVRDSGPGFPAEYLPHAFERFARPDSGRARSDGGAGLGLAIVSAIARAHGGRATAANQPGGAVATLQLPGAVEQATGQP
ncbi:MAG TPA: ATP-binding protein [Streptosporangiaceae bacterium]|nr:ATP-binding protein [Streptosporangiaceae bacterium]